MIVKVRKFIFYGVKDQLNLFFSKAQEKGFIQFIGSNIRKLDYPNHIKNVISAIKVLKKQPTIIDQQETQKIDKIAEDIVSLQSSLDKAYEKERQVRTEIERISPLGNFSKNDLDYIENEGKRFLQFFCIRSTKVGRIKIPKEMIYVNTEYDLDYFVVVDKEKKNYPLFIELVINKSLGELKDQLEDLLKKQKKHEEDLKNLTAYLSSLKEGLLTYLNKYSLNNAKTSAFLTLEDSLFVIEAWIPISKIDELKILTDEMAIEYESIAVEKNDKIPTCMENQGSARIGEDLVNIYDVPSNTDKDPSIWVLCAFSLFFAMIIADAGYGLLYFILAIVMHFFIKNKKPMIKRLVKLTFILSVSCITWGIITGSFFGLGVDPSSPLNKITAINYLVERKASYHLKNKDDVYSTWLVRYPKVKDVDNAHDFLLVTSKEKNSKIVYEAWDIFQKNVLMELSLLIGSLHICLSFLRYLRRHYAGFGWILFIVGGYLFCPSILDATSMFVFLGFILKPFAFVIGKYMMFSGIGIAVLLSIVQNGLLGVKEITNVISIFGDIMSYLRLYALGLAGMILAGTFNELGASLGFGGIIVILLGHVVNMQLGLIGGVIHGLRLNFIEWYHYSFEGDGKLFNPLKLLK